MAATESSVACQASVMSNLRQGLTRGDRCHGSRLPRSHAMQASLPYLKHYLCILLVLIVFLELSWISGWQAPAVDHLPVRKAVRHVVTSDTPRPAGRLPLRSVEWVDVEKRLKYYEVVNSQPIVGEPRGRIIVLHMGRCGSTLLQTRAMTLLGPEYGVQNMKEGLQPNLVLPVLRKYMEMIRRGDGGGVATLDGKAGMLAVERYLELDEESDPLDLFDPGSPLQLDGLRERRQEEYLALVHALRFLTTGRDVSSGKAIDKTITSLKIWTICELGFGVGQFLEAMAEAGVEHVVAVHRNYLRRLVSKLTAQGRSQWHSMLEENVNCKRAVTVDLHAQDHCDPEEEYGVTDLFRQADAVYERLFAAEGALLFPDAVVISYEKDLYHNEGERGLTKLRRHFGLVDKKPGGASSLLKTADCPLPDLIVNYDEVAEELVGTRWWYCLEGNGQQVAMGNPIELVLDPPKP